MISFRLFFKKVVSKLHLKIKIFVCLSKHKYISINEENYVNAKKYLNEISKDPNTSSITHNNISHEVDLHIIVPAYNVEKYICQCIDSIANPSKNISYHLTVINDGSTDNTGKLLERYADISQIDIITQSNKGFSGARNSGLKNIKGRYICFVDSDDWTNWSELEKMVKEADKKGADLVQGGFYITDELGNLKKEIKSTKGHFTGFPWGKIYKSELFESTCFPEKYWFEDSVIKQIIFEKVKYPIVFSEAVYYYRQRKSSITRTSRMSVKSIDSLYVTLSLHKDRKELGFDNTQEYYDYILYMFYLTYGRTAAQNNKVMLSIFTVFAYFIKKEFPDYNTYNKQYKLLEKFIKDGDFGKCKALCQWTCL